MTRETYPEYNGVLVIGKCACAECQALSSPSVTAFSEPHELERLQLQYNLHQNTPIREVTK